MKHGKRRKGNAESFLSVLLAAVMMLSLAPENALTLTVYAEETDTGLCGHHRSHRLDCGYREAASCTHEHTDECYTEKTSCIHVHDAGCYGGELPAEGEDGEVNTCAHVCSEDSGCIIKELSCTHEHDGSCGYAEAAPCGYVCKICPVQERIDALPDGSEITAENAADVETRLAGIDEAKGELTDEELDALDTARYEDAVSALLALEGMERAAVPQTLAGGIVVTDTATEWTDGNTYTVSGEVTISARVKVTGAVTLILNEGCKLTVNGGIEVTEGNSLTIQGIGELAADASSASGCAGIGGSSAYNGNSDSGEIIIEGGTVTATGGQDGAGIGGGGSYNVASSHGNGSNITINGGTVTATGGRYGAGIGGGYCSTIKAASLIGGNGSHIIINGGTVKATGGQYGAGIGGGCYKCDFCENLSGGNGSDITISGGYVEAIGGQYGAGIGGGYRSSDSIGGNGNDIIISGGTVIAIGISGGGAGIGGGNGGNGSNITISGGTVKATSTNSAGIGGGQNGSGTGITIDSGTVIAVGSEGAGIGGGYNGDGEVTVKGGNVTATSKQYGAGIGGGYGKGGVVTISGGTVIAQGGAGMESIMDSDGVPFGIGGGAGIGSGGCSTMRPLSPTVTVTISGGTVTATGGAVPTGDGSIDVYGGAGIGLGGLTTGGATFSTTGGPAAGSAFIVAVGGVGDASGNGSDAKPADGITGGTPSGTSGIIFQGDEGQVYGNQILAANAEIPGGKTLTIPNGTSLTVEGSTTLTNNGTLINNGTLTVQGNLSGSGSIGGGGTFSTETLTEAMIVVPTGMYYTGGDLSDAIKEKMGASICGQAFTVDESVWTLTVEKISDLEYKAAYTHKTNGTALFKTITGFKVMTPQISPAGGSVEDSVSVSIACGTPGAEVYYTTDGSVPTQNSTRYTGAFTVTPPATVKAIALKDGLTDSAAASVQYTKKDSDSETGNSTDSGQEDNGDNGSGNAAPGIPVTLPAADTGAKPESKSLPTRPGSQTGPGNSPFQGTGTDTEKPFIKGKDGKIGWDIIRDEEEKAAEGSVINVDMNGATVVPGDIFDRLRGRDITITFDMDNGILWSVDGKSVTTGRTGDIDFSVKTGTKAIPVDIINNVTGENYNIQLSLAHEGEFGFTAVLSIGLGRENAGYTANLYYYNEKTGELEFICMDEVAEDGTAELTFTHASDYLIAIDTKPADEKEETDAVPETVENDDNSAVTDTMTKEDAGAYQWLLIVGAVVIVAGVGIFLVRKKLSY